MAASVVPLIHVFSTGPEKVDQSPSSWILASFGGAYFPVYFGIGGSVTIAASVVPLIQVFSIGPV